MSGIVVLIFRILLLAALYGFLGWAIYILWKDLHTTGDLISAPAIPALTLEPPDAEETLRQAFTQPEVILGRSASTDYPIPDETVSSRPARLSYHHKQWWLEDLNSTNGTFLNDERVSVATVIVPGDELRIGNVVLLIGIGDKEAKP